MNTWTVGKPSLGDKHNWGGSNTEKRTSIFPFPSPSLPLFHLSLCIFHSECLKTKSALTWNTSDRHSRWKEYPMQRSRSLKLHDGFEKKHVIGYGLWSGDVCRRMMRNEAKNVKWGACMPWKEISMCSFSNVILKDSTWDNIMTIMKKFFSLDVEMDYMVSSEARNLVCLVLF